MEGSVLHHAVSIEDMVGAKVQVRFIVNYSQPKYHGTKYSK